MVPSPGGEKRHCDYLSSNGAPQAAKPYRDKRIYSLLQNFFFFFFPVLNIDTDDGLQLLPP